MNYILAVWRPWRNLKKQTSRSEQTWQRKTYRDSVCDVVYPENYAQLSFFPDISTMDGHFVQLKLGKDPHRPTKVSTVGCIDVDDFIKAIKNMFPNLLATYSAAELTL